MIFAGISLTASAAFSADMPVKAAKSGCVQAVDGVNGKVAAWGGSYANKSIYGTTGSLSVPVACEWGAQFDATAASFDSRFLGSGGGHYFWRDPSKALVGAYGRYTYWDQVGGVKVAHIGPEAELYLGRVTLKGVAGVEFGNKPSGTINGLTTTYDNKTRFFDQMDVAYYLTDNLEAYIGHRYLGGKHALALGGEYGIQMGKTMTSLFVEGRAGEGSFHGVWGGVRFYFGQKDKTLIRRHREDDPTDWGAGIDGAGNTGTSTPAPAVRIVDPTGEC